MVVMNIKILTLLVMIMALLAACGDSPAQQAALPTAAVLPTLPSATPSSTPTPTLPATETPAPSDTPTLDPALTQTPPTLTPSATITDTVTPTPTITFTPSWTPAPTDTPSAIGGLLAIAVSYTPLPAPSGVWPRPAGSVPVDAASTTTAPSTCLALPSGGFGAVYSSDPQLAGQLGCPIGTPPITTVLPSATQQYERGLMIWVQTTPGSIYALSSSGSFERYDDTWVEGVDPDSGGMTAPPGLLEPVRGFGKVWRTNPNVQNGLGWAASEEASGQATMQDFERGRMIYLTQRNEILVLVFTGGPNVGIWRAVAGSF